MSQSTSAGLQRAGTDDRRTALDALDFPPKTGKRAVYEEFEFRPAAGRVEVTNASHGADAGADHTYTVDVRDGVPASCTCPADEYHAGACKHRVAVALREPVLEAAAPEPVTDGGVVEADAAADVDGPAYTYHREPARVGGARYVRCERCGAECVPADPDRLAHRDGCPEGR